MGLKNKIYNYEKIIERNLSRIRESAFCEENKKALLDFHRDCVIQGLSKARITKYLDTLFRITSWLGKPFFKVTGEDIADLVQRVESNGYSEWTKHDYKAMLKVFFKWLKKADDYPDEVRWIITTPKTKRKMPEELLTPDDIRMMVDTADNLRDKAFVLVLYESGCRIGEILTLQIKHVQFDNYGAVLLVDGKTGQRRVRVIVSASKLNQWVENHPLHNDPNAPLWITMGTNSRYKPLMYRSATDVLKTLAKKAGIKKRVYAHLFRHSRATHLANHLTEAQMKQYFGWVQGSEMASVYVHLSGRDVDQALFRLNGMNVQEVQREQKFKAAICPRCRGRNSPDSKFCTNCGMCLDVKTAVKIDETRAKADRLLTVLVKKPEVLDSLLNAVEQVSE